MVSMRVGMSVSCALAWTFGGNWRGRFSPKGAALRIIYNVALAGLLVKKMRR